MGMKVIAGRAKSGTSDAILEGIKNRTTAGEHAVLIVPEQYSFQAERDLVEKLDKPGILGTEVLSFSRLVHRVLEVEGDQGRNPISDLGRIMLLGRIFEEYGREFGIFGGAFRKKGFLSQLNGFLNELKKNDILPEELVFVAADLDGSEMLKDKLKDIALAYDHLESRLKEKYADTWDDYRLAEERILNSDRYGETVFFVDGFAGFTGREKGLLKALLRQSGQVVVALACDPSAGSDAYVFANTTRTLRELRDMAAEGKTSFELEILKAPEGSGSLDFIQNNFYRYPTRRYTDEPAGIRLFSARNRYSEVENAAGEILRLCEEKGCRYRDIGVLCDMSLYGNVIERVFAEFDIPYFIDRKRPIAGSALARYVLAALEIVERNFRYEEVFAFLKTGLTDIDRETVERLENHVLARGIRGTLWKKPFTMEDAEESTDVEAARTSIWESFGVFGEALGKARTIHENVVALCDFLKAGEVEEKMEAFVENLMKAGDYEYASEYAQIWNIFMEIFDQMIEVGGDEPTDLKTFKSILKTGIDAYEVGIIPTTVDQILVGGLKRTRSHQVRALFILGVNDRVIPTVVEDAGIMLDEEIRLMQEKGLRLNMDGDTRVDEERLALYSAMSRPEEYLWFSYALADSEGQGLRPSLLIGRLKQLFPRLQEEGDHLGPRFERIMRAPGAAYGHLVEALRRHIEELKPIGEEEKALASWFRNQPTYADLLDNTRKAMFHDNRAWNMAPETTGELYGLPLRPSSSRIERFYQCPFQHFVRYGLRPSERKIYELKSPDVGRIFHESIEDFTRTVAERNLDWENLSKETVDTLMDETLEKIIGTFDGKILGSTERYRYFADRIGRVARKAAGAAAEHVQKGTFRPAAVEAAFGVGKRLPPLLIETEKGEKVFLEGRIDRLDLCEEGESVYVKVIDYKSYDKLFRIDDAYYGLQIQLPVYMNAALSVPEGMDKEAVPAGIFYFKIDDPMVEDSGLTAEELDAAVRGSFKMKGIVLREEMVIKLMDIDLKPGESSDIVPAKLKQDGNPGQISGSLDMKDFKNLLDYAMKAVKEGAEGILNGVIEAHPFRKGGERACTWCDFASICQFDTDLEGNTYHNLKKMKDNEALQRMAEALSPLEDGLEKGGSGRD